MGKRADPVLVTFKSNVTAVPIEPNAGSAALSTVIFASLAWISALSLAVTFWPCSGLAETSTWLVRVLVPDIGPSILATISRVFFSPGSRDPISDQDMLWFCPTPAGVDEI